MAARDRELAAAIARAVRDFDRSLVLYGLAGSELIRAGRDAGIAVANEVFADRTYQADGSLTPRSRPDALIHDVEVSLAQVKRMVRDQQVQAVDGTIVAIEAGYLVHPRRCAAGRDLRCPDPGRAGRGWRCCAHDLAPRPPASFYLSMPS